MSLLRVAPHEERRRIVGIMSQSRVGPLLTARQISYLRTRFNVRVMSAFALMASRTSH
jgi:hypothetical protein